MDALAVRKLGIVLAMAVIMVIAFSVYEGGDGFMETPSFAHGDEVTVTLNPEVKYQTIRGWSCNPHYLGASPRQLRDVIRDAVNELGITRIRWQQPNGNRSDVRRWEWENDNGDPFELWLSPSFFNRGNTGSVPTWLLTTIR